MPKYTSQNYTVKNLQTLLKKHDELTFEAGRHRQMATDAEAEEKALLEKSDLNNPKQFEALGQARLKRELAPRKVEEFTAAAGELLNAIDEECKELISGLQDVLADKMSNCLKRIAGSLVFLFRGREADCWTEAGQIFHQTNYGRQQAIFTQYLRTEGLEKKLPIFKAKAVLEVSARIFLLEIDTEATGSPWEAKTAEKFQDEELARLLTSDGHEEFVLSKINLLRGGLSREQAEKSVDGRIKFLQAEQERRGIAAR